MEGSGVVWRGRRAYNPDCALRLVLARTNDSQVRQLGRPPLDECHSCDNLLRIFLACRIVNKSHQRNAPYLRVGWGSRRTDGGVANQGATSRCRRRTSNFSSGQAEPSRFIQCPGIFRSPWPFHPDSSFAGLGLHRYCAIFPADIGLGAVYLYSFLIVIVLS